MADYHGIPFLETSAKTGENVEEAFSLISQAIYDKVQYTRYQTHSFITINSRPRLEEYDNIRWKEESTKSRRAGMGLRLASSKDQGWDRW